jgi:hypothetical protein
MEPLTARYQALLSDPDPIMRATAHRQLAALRGRRRAAPPVERSAWLHVPLGELFAAAGNQLRERPNGTIITSHEPAHGSKSGACLVIWPEEGRWWCSSCRRGGDAVQAVKSLEGASYPAAVARLIDRYGRPEGWR